MGPLNLDHLPDGSLPHAASVFYAVDESLRLVFLSKPSSMHGLHIGAVAPVAVTVAEESAGWESIRGVQLWGEARRLQGAFRAVALALYTRRFPFVRDFARDPRLAQAMRGISVYRVDPRWAALTDNATGVFGRELLRLVIE